MKASIIIPTLNRRKELAECLESIFGCSQQSSLLEVIVIDNNSSDGTLEFLREFAAKAPKLRFIQINQRDAIRARNLGFSLALGDIVIHIDDDIVVDKEWLRNLTTAYVDETVGGVGGRLLNSGQISKAKSMLIVGRIAPWGQFFTNFDALLPREVGFLHGSNASFRRDLVVKVKGLDLSYKTNWRDDTDLCVRIRKLGYKLLFQPAALVWHKCAGSSTRFSSENKVYGHFWNREYFYYKNVFTLKNFPYSPIFAFSEVAFCVTLCARNHRTRYLRKCFQGMRDGSAVGLRSRCKSGNVANP